MRADAVVARPAATLLADPRAGRERTRIATALAETLARRSGRCAGRPPCGAAGRGRATPARPPRGRAAGRRSSGGARPPSRAAAGRRTARRVAQLRERARASAKGRPGDVLALVLALRGADLLARRDLHACATTTPSASRSSASRARAVPTTPALRELSLGSREPAWFRRVIDERRPLRAAPDRRRRPPAGGAPRQRDSRRGLRRADRDAATASSRCSTPTTCPGEEPLGDTRRPRGAAPRGRHRARPRPARAHARDAAGADGPARRGAKSPDARSRRQRRATSAQKSASATQELAPRCRSLARAGDCRSRCFQEGSRATHPRRRGLGRPCAR